MYFLCHLQFPIRKVNQSCIDLLDLDLWLSVVLISRVSLFVVHSWLSLSLSLYGLNLYISKCRNKWIIRCLLILDKLVCFRLKLNSKLYNSFLFVFHQTLRKRKEILAFFHFALSLYVDLGKSALASALLSVWKGFYLSFPSVVKIFISRKDWKSLLLILDCI